MNLRRFKLACGLHNLSAKRGAVATIGALLYLLAVPGWAAAKTITCYSDVFAPFVTLEGSDIRGIDVDAIAEAGRRVGIRRSFKMPAVMQTIVAYGTYRKIRARYL